MLLWSSLALRNRDGPEPISLPELQEQWTFSSDELFSLTPLMIAAAIMAAIVILIRSGLPQLIWRACTHVLHDQLQVVRPANLSPMQKWTLLRIARHGKVSPPSALLISPHTFDHHAQAYARSVQPRRHTKVQSRINKIRGMTFGSSAHRHSPFKLRMNIEHSDALTPKLAAAGATHVRDVMRVTTYYQNPGHGGRSSQEWLGPELSLVLEQDFNHQHRHGILSWTKPPGSDSPRDTKTADLPAGDVSMISDLINDLGYCPTRRVETERRRWTWYGCGISLDTVPYLGRFVEIDGPSEAAIQKVRGRLGLDALPLVEDTDQTMLEDALASRNIQDEYISLAHDEHATPRHLPRPRARPAPLRTTPV